MSPIRVLHSVSDVTKANKAYFNQSVMLSTLDMARCDTINSRQ